MPPAPRRGGPVLNRRRWTSIQAAPTTRKPAADRLTLRSSDSRTMYGKMYDVANGDTPYSTCAGDCAHLRNSPYPGHSRCARVDSNHHPGNPGQGPQPFAAAVDAFSGVEIVQI